MVSAKIVVLVAATFLSSAFLQGCGGGGDKPDESNTIPGIAGKTSDLSALVKALNTAGLVSILEGKGPFTVFAPTNDAFDALPFEGAELKYLLNNNSALTEVLKYHVASGDVTSSDLKNGEKIEMLAGGNVTVTVTNKSGNLTFTINDAKVTTPDVTASNGVMQIIDKVLIPEGLYAPNIPTLAASLTSANLSTLVEAVGAADLGAALSGGPLTVFAPTNEAFNKTLGEGLLAKLLLPANQPSLQQLLKYHVHAGEVESTDLTNGENVTTLEKKNLTISIENGKVQVHGGKGSSANVTQANVLAVNGVVHVIDAVLLPSDWVPPTSTEDEKVSPTSTKDEKVLQKIVV